MILRQRLMEGRREVYAAERAEPNAFQLFTVGERGPKKTRCHAYHGLKARLLQRSAIAGIIGVGIDAGPDAVDCLT
jgi:hypothetical protein